MIAAAPALPVPSEIDGTLLDWMLALSVEQRIAALQGAIDSACELMGLASAASTDK